MEQEGYQNMTGKGTARLILHWCLSTFGDVALDRKERAMRLFEEAVEVAQSVEVDKAMLGAILKRTYSRPVGDLHKEMGAVLLTTYALAALDGLDPDRLLEDEVTRVLSKPRKHWKDKHDAKVVDGTATA